MSLIWRSIEALMGPFRVVRTQRLQALSSSSDIQGGRPAVAHLNQPIGNPMV